MKILNVKLPNGAVASGTFEEWTVALLGGLTQEQMTAVVERMHQIQGAKAMQALPAPSGILMQAPAHTIMKAEPGALGAILGGRRG